MTSLDGSTDDTSTTTAAAAEHANGKLVTSFSYYCYSHYFHCYYTYFYYFYLYDFSYHYNATRSYQGCCYGHKPTCISALER
jgi:hypothetical protein